MKIAIAANSSRDDELERLRREVQKLHMSRGEAAKEISLVQCTTCVECGHYAAACSMAAEDWNYEQANAMYSDHQGGYDQPRGRNEAFSNTYNPGWRQHSNFSWGNSNVQ